MRYVLSIFAVGLSAAVANAELVKVTAGGNRRAKAGHGVYVGRDIVLTAFHVISNASPIRVQFLEGGPRITGRLARKSNRYDLAAVRLDQIPSGRQASETISTWPSGIVRTFRATGKPRRGVRNGRGNEIFTWTGGSIKGDSGAPVVDSAGRVVSLVSASGHGQTHGPPPEAIYEMASELGVVLVAPGAT